MLRKAFLALALALFAPSAWATTYYVCDCQAGAEGGCTAGADGNTGTLITQPKQTFSAALNLASAGACGDVVKLCMGGRWSITSQPPTLTHSVDCTSNPITIEDYQPGAFTARPTLTATTGVNFFQVGENFSATPFRGLRIQDLKIIGPGLVSAGHAVFVPGLAGTRLWFSNNHVSFVSTGINVGEAGIVVDWTSNLMEDIGFYGWLGTPGSGSRFVGNEIARAASACTRGGGNDCAGIRPVYMGLDDEVTDIAFTDNYIHDSCRNSGSGGDGACSCNPLSIRGGTRLTFARNRIVEIDTGGTRSNSYRCSVRFNSNGGSAHNESPIDSRYGENTFIGIEEVNFCGGTRNTYENNVFAYPDMPSVLASSTPIALAFTTPAQCGGGAEDLPEDQFTIRNNSVYFADTAHNEVHGYQIRATNGGGHRFYGNVFHLVGAPGNSTAIDFQGDLVDWTFDYNVVHRDGGGTSFARTGGSAQRTLAQWRADLGGCPGAGNECAGVEGNPQFVSPGSPNFNLALGASSVAKDIGPSSDAPFFSSTDFLGIARPQNGLFDAGAYEFQTDIPGTRGAPGGGGFSIGLLDRLIDGHRASLELVSLARAAR